MTGAAAESLPDLVATWRERITGLRRVGDLVALLTAAETAADEIEHRAGACRNDVEREALMAIKRLTFNTAADCWPGWSVPDTPPDTHLLTRALALAKRSVALVDKLGLDGVQQGTGLWLVGAFELALDSYDDAYSAFALARERYAAASAPGLVMLTDGYIALLSEIARHQIPASGEDLDQVCARMANGGFEDGAEWIEQLRTARTVFKGS